MWPAITQARPAPQLQLRRLGLLRWPPRLWGPREGWTTFIFLLLAHLAVVWSVERAQYVTKQKTVVRIGGNGVTGIIGWFIPKYLLAQYPAFKNWSGLKGKESIFKSPESGSQGMFLGGDPSYVQKDKELIETLGLDFKHV